MRKTATINVRVDEADKQSAEQFGPLMVEAYQEAESGQVWSAK